jgi:hypothetical protein
MNATTKKLTRRDRQAIAQYLREMACDTHTLLNLVDANLCGDVAGILRARASRLETTEDGAGLLIATAERSPLYAQT